MGGSGKYYYYVAKILWPSSPLLVPGFFPPLLPWRCGSPLQITLSISAGLPSSFLSIIDTLNQREAPPVSQISFMNTIQWPQIL